MERQIDKGLFALRAAARAEQRARDAALALATKDPDGPFDDGSSDCGRCGRPLIHRDAHIKGWNAAADHIAAAILAQEGKA